ncbi:MAG: hypothetical protein GXP55_04450 [Deltaproteobacteria bacterium]|nr:hypothetical protein [Deltaproteobacteria bacterium]
MIKRATLLGAIMALSLAGCGGGGGRGSDDAGIMLMDSGSTATDSSTGTDSGTTTDSGSGGTCDVGATGLTGAGCFPRCAMATLTAVNACADTTCLQTALGADTTPGIMVTPPGSAAVEVKCLQCYALQQNSCAAESCPTEFSTWATCSQGGGACTAENTALNTCISASSTFQPCAQSRIGMCFGA